MVNKKPDTRFDQFSSLDIRVGTIVEAGVFKEARHPAYLLKIDFGPLGVLKSSAQITALYEPESLLGKQIIAVVNFPPKQIANIMSECLVLGALNNGEVSLLKPDLQVANGTSIA